MIEAKKYLKTPSDMASTSFKTTLVITKAVAQKNIPMKAQCLAVNFLKIWLKSIF